MNEYTHTELLAWIGEDEYGSGEVGIKQAITAAGYVPLAAIGEHRAKLERLRPAMEAQARQWGKKIRLCRYTFVEVVLETAAGA